MSRSARPLNHGVEAINLVSRVGDLADVAVRFHQAVGAVHHAVLQRLRGVFVVTSGGVCHAVREAIRGVWVYWLSADHLVNKIVLTDIGDS